MTGVLGNGIDHGPHVPAAGNRHWVWCRFVMLVCGAGVQKPSPPQCMSLSAWLSLLADSEIVSPVCNRLHAAFSPLLCDLVTL